MEVHNATSFLGHGGMAQHLQPVLESPFAESILALTPLQGIALFLCLFWGYSSLTLHRRIKVPGAPVHGYWSWLEPTWLLQLRYAKDAHKIIASGYKRYNVNGKPFVLRRQDLDITVLPTKYVAELRTIPNAKLSRGKANFMEWGDQWAMKNLWSHIDLPIKVISENRHGQQGKYLEAMRKEFEHAMEVEMPQVDDWTAVDIQKIIQMILARMVGKMIVGKEACRSPEWLDLAEHFTEDFVGASIIMRMLPKWTHPLVTNLLPQRWRMRRRLRDAVNITNPCVTRHREAREKRAKGIEVDYEDNMVGWMLDNAPDKQYVLDHLPILILIILVPAAHTTAMGISNLLFHLCEYPEWGAKLLKEINDVNNEFGPIGERLPAKDWVTKLDLLDSFFNESQRLSQPLSITPNRYAVEDFTFKDGLHIPKGALLGWVSIHNQIDPKIAPDPDTFDPLRSYRKRQVSAEENAKHLAGQPSLENLTFGYGSQACPGRNIAITVLKMILSRILRDYEFKFGDGQARPQNIYLLEFIIPDPKAKLMVRKREASVS
uniref:Cytochrome P450 monooxygenase sdnB n=1 Tax=Sordaria araneosa TaxID=573841 RepID=SDNB_SORAA|nr:RecName: Full=Cytochrome P450 monooxygenase sdnB; AltName: Full=Sordarin/hypoxysordarin biosynthesis cluster protein B [Sordaria araneosa]BAV32146.1 cytochrome P450 monooxygenase [Sordaria araneosa]